MEKSIIYVSDFFSLPELPGEFIDLFVHSSLSTPNSVFVLWVILSEIVRGLADPVVGGKKSQRN